MRMKTSTTQKWMILLTMEEMNKRKSLNTSRTFLVTIDRGEHRSHVFWLQVMLLSIKFYRTDFLFALNFLRYKDESDYALKFMETSWKEVQKEEAKR